MKGRGPSLGKKIQSRLARAGSGPMVKQRCPHCKYRWKPVRGKEVQWCPKCHLDLTAERPVRKPRIEDVKILDSDRFTPGRMQKLCRLKLYKYVGVPRNLPPVATPIRLRKRDTNMRLADRFFREDINGSDMADTLKIRRQAFYQRIQKAFDLMVVRGSFQITAKGREKIAREKMEMAATSKKVRRSASSSLRSGAE